MARITVEDCLNVVPNRFSLVLVAAERAKQLLRGADVRIADTDNKEAVTALREIAANHFEIDETEVLAVDTWKPWHRQAASELDDEGALDDELPPEA